MAMTVKFSTKQALEAAVAADAASIRVQNPGLRASWKTCGKQFFSLREMEIGASIAVTNHPQRSWTAVIRRTAATTWEMS